MIRIPEKKGGTAINTWFNTMITLSTMPFSCFTVYTDKGMEITTINTNPIRVIVMVIGILSITISATGML